jgi:hypothetical protein
MASGGRDLGRGPQSWLPQPGECPALGPSWRQIQRPGIGWEREGEGESVNYGGSTLPRAAGTPVPDPACRSRWNRAGMEIGAPSRLTYGRAARVKAGQSHPQATLKPSTSQLLGRGLRPSCDPQATHKPPPCDPHATLKPPQSLGKARDEPGDWEELPWATVGYSKGIACAPVGISVAPRWRVTVQAGTRSTASVTSPEKNGTRWNTSLPRKVAHGRGTAQQLQRRHRAPALY